MSTTANGKVTSTLIQTLLERSEADLKDKFSKFLALAIGLIYLGKGEQVEVIIEFYPLIHFTGLFYLSDIIFISFNSIFLP